jgi:protein-disulfide isomerase
LPPLAAVTSTVTVQEPLPGIEPPAKVTVEVPVVTVPPQVVLAIPSITTPVGNVSVNEALVATVASGLLNVIVRVDVSPASMVAGLKALLSVGGMGVTGGPAHAETVTMLESIVTAPFCARALPETVAPVVRVTLASARIFPVNEVVVPSVAELPICQKTLHC